MTISIDLQSSVPIYQQIRTNIIRAISSGELKGGDVLPSIRQLGVDLGINMHTVAKAYNLLKNDGYIVMDRRSTAKVSTDIYMDDNDIDRVETLISDAAIEAIGKKISKEEFLIICSKVFEQNGGV